MEGCGTGTFTGASRSIELTPDPFANMQTDGSRSVDKYYEYFGDIEGGSMRMYIYHRTEDFGVNMYGSGDSFDVRVYSYGTPALQSLARSLEKEGWADSVSTGNRYGYGGYY